MLAALRFPDQARVFALCYDHDVAIPYSERTIFDPECSWAAGRNRLLALALEHCPDTDYFVFCDDDIVFVTGSFEKFEAMVAQTQPAMAVPAVPKTRKFTNWNLEVQTVLRLDEQLVALHRSVIGFRGIAPLVEDYDAISWYIPCLIFEYCTLKLYGRACHQYNNVVIVNDVHRQSDVGSNYKTGDEAEIYRLFEEFIVKEFGYIDKMTNGWYSLKYSRNPIEIAMHRALAAEALRLAGNIVSRRL